MTYKPGDEVEVRLTGKVIEILVVNATAKVELLLARPSRGISYTTFVDQQDLHAPGDDSIRQMVVEVPRVCEEHAKANICICNPKRRLDQIRTNPYCKAKHP